MVAWDSVLLGAALLLYALIPEPSDVIPIVGWIDEGVAVGLGVKMIYDGVQGKSVKESFDNIVRFLREAVGGR